MNGASRERISDSAYPLAKEMKEILLDRKEPSIRIRLAEPSR
jgi:hypothetical protein